MSYSSPSYPVTDFKVMKSAAGFYIGRGCFPEPDFPNLEHPYDRASGYFPTAEAAEEALESKKYWRS